MCKAALSLCRRCLAWSCEVVDGCLDSSSYTRDPTKAGHTESCSAKRRRIDEDFRTTVVADVARQGLAANAAGYLRAVDKCSSKNANPWGEKFLLKYQASGWLTGARATTVCCCLDAPRVGNPAENTEIFGAQLFGPPSKDLFMWLPPQAGFADATSHVLLWGNLDV